jgi:hypothetical protein
VEGHQFDGKLNDGHVEGHQFDGKLNDGHTDGHQFDGKFHDGHVEGHQFDGKNGTLLKSMILGICMSIDPKEKPGQSNVSGGMLKSIIDGHGGIEMSPMSIQGKTIGGKLKGTSGV